MGVDQNQAFQLSLDSSQGGLRPSWKLLASTIVLVLCTTPTLVSYAPYSFRWDDSDYLWRSIAVSRAFWSGNAHELRMALVSIRPPVMTLLGIPWGPLTSWDDAGKCFITLTAFNAFFVACCLFLLLRIGLKPIHLVIGSVSALAALGPFHTNSDAHISATGFMADSLFAWIAFAATLLIPYEAAAGGSSTADSMMRGVLWATILLAGVMTKVSFFYFIVLIVPILFAARIHHSGIRSALVTMISLVVCSVPAAVYYVVYGQSALKNGFAASFGPDAPFYHVPLSQFLIESVRESPGLLLVMIVTTVGIVYLLLRRLDAAWSINALPLLIIAGYGTIALASSNRDIRYVFPAIIAPPFLIGILLSDKTYAFSRRHAVMAAMLVFCCLLGAGAPMLHRANRHSIYLSEVVLAQAVASNAKHVLLATDSSSLNDSLMKLALAVSPSRPQIETNTLAWRAASGVPIEVDFHDIRESDLVVFQDNEELDSPPSNQRVSEYEQYMRQRFGDMPIKTVDGIRMYDVGRLRVP